MKYVFFDIECANCWESGKICSFGYVITDESYNVLEKTDLVINPDAKFDLRGLAMGGIKLAYPVDYYYSQPKFSYYYKRIKELLTAPEHIIIGHSTQSDAQYLLDECRRYGLPSFDYTYADTVRIFRYLLERSKDLKLKVLFDELCGEEENTQEHKSEDDAYMTMRVAQYAVEKLNKRTEEIMRENPLVTGEVFLGRIVNKDECLLGYSKSLKMNHTNGRAFSDYIYERGGERKGASKSFIVSKRYEQDNFPSMLKIAERLYDRGYRYTQNVEAANCFVDIVEKDPRKKYLVGNRRTHVFDFPSFLELIDIKEEELLPENVNVEEILSKLPSNADWYRAYKEKESKK